MQLELRSVSLVYDPDVQNPEKAVDNISLTVEKGEFVGLIGHTGSGKSPLVQLMNGLLVPTEGTVLLDGRNVHEKGFPLKTLRQKVGLVFQYPEYQLFEETVLKDVCFGPKNMGLSASEQEARAKKALSRVGLGERYYEASPFELSGGEKRRAAIAGVLAMEPDILILDEPTRGIDVGADGSGGALLAGLDVGVADALEDEIEEDQGQEHDRHGRQCENPAVRVDRLHLVGFGALVDDGVVGARRSAFHYLPAFTVAGDAAATVLRTSERDVLREVVAHGDAVDDGLAVTFRENDFRQPDNHPTSTTLLRIYGSHPDNNIRRLPLGRHLYRRNSLKSHT